MSETTEQAWTSDSGTIQVQVSGDLPPGTAEYAERRLRQVIEAIHVPVLHARIRITRYPDPALPRPVVAQANLDVDGRFVRAQLAGPTAREAVDLLHDRLRHRVHRAVQRAEGNWEDRRARRASPEEHEWRHGDEATRRPPYFPRPPDEREVIRHKSVTPARCGLDEAAADMEDLAFDFHLFAEAGTGQDAVLYRSGPTEHRLALVAPVPEAALAPHSLPVTVSDQPAPRYAVRDAVARMAVWDQPFLFFVDTERDRGALLYHRYDGHYGLIEANSREGTTS